MANTDRESRDNTFLIKLRGMIHSVVCISILCLIIGTASEYDTVTYTTIICTDPTEKAPVVIANQSCQSAYEEIAGVKSSIVGLLWFRSAIIALFGACGMAFILMEIYKDNIQKKATVYITILLGAIGILIAGLFTTSLTNQLPWIVIVATTVYLIFTGIDISGLEYLATHYAGHKIRITLALMSMIWSLEWVIFGTNCALVRVVELNDIDGIRQKALDIRWYGWAVSFVITSIMVTIVHGNIFMKMEDPAKLDIILLVLWNMIVIGILSWALSQNAYVFCIILPLVIIVAVSWSLSNITEWNKKRQKTHSEHV